KIRKVYCETSLRPDEYSRVLAEAAGHPRDYRILQVFLHTGIRVSELVAIVLSDLDLQQKTLTIHGKGNREREIPLEKKVLQALKLYLFSSKKWSCALIHMGRFIVDITMIC